MNDRLFPRWNTALFALLPLSEILFLPATAQTGYAVLLACLICSFLCAAAQALTANGRTSPPVRWAAAVLALWTFGQMLVRMSAFWRVTAFPARRFAVLLLTLLLCAGLAACRGFSAIGMGALPVAWVSGALTLLSIALTVPDCTLSAWQAPSPALLPLTADLLRTLLPAALALSVTTDAPAASAARGLLCGGLLAALSASRAVLLLGAHTAALFAYPCYTAAGLASLGDFARHGEVFFAVPLFVCAWVQLAALAQVAISPFRRR